MRTCFLHLLTRNDLIGEIHSTVFTSTYLVTYGSIKVHKYCTRYVFHRACLGKKRLKRVVATADGQVTHHRTIELDTVFETVEIPAGITRLDTTLAKMD